MAVATEAVVTERWDGLLLGPTLATLDTGTGYGLVEDGALGWNDGLLTYVGPRSGLPGDAPSLADDVIEAEGLVTPGLIDCHTHLVFAGDRAQRIRDALEGRHLCRDRAAGGGILSTVRATRAASEDELVRDVAATSARIAARRRDHAGDQVGLWPRPRRRTKATARGARRIGSKRSASR
jgi:imidazolonepropionase-like amidohydrolase